VRRITGGAVTVRGYGVVKLARWLRITAGIPAHSGKDSLAHILWLKHQEPETYRRAHVFLEPKDWLNARLTGRLAASFDSIALHWVTDNRHPGRIRYDPALLRMAGIEQSRLPELLAATDILGPLAAGPASELGVPAGIPVVAGTPDLQSAAIALGELTSGQIPDRVRVVRSYDPDPAHDGLYDGLFREFVGLYRRNRKAYARLNRERASV
jgi:xylulokinase